MRHLQTGLVDEPASPSSTRSRSSVRGAPGNGAFAAEVALDLRAVRRAARAALERRLADHDGVQVERLLLQPFAFRLGFDDVGERESERSG